MVEQELFEEVYGAQDWEEDKIYGEYVYEIIKKEHAISYWQSRLTRTKAKPEEVADIKISKSIRQHGIQVATMGVLTNEKHLPIRIFAGNKRLMEGQKEIPVKIYRKLTEDQIADLEWIENEMRLSLSQEDKGEFVDRYMRRQMLLQKMNPDMFENGNYPTEIIRECAIRYGVTSSTIRNWLYSKYHQAPKKLKVKKMLSTKQSTKFSDKDAEGIALMITDTNDPEEMAKAIQTFDEHNLTYEIAYKIGKFRKQQPKLGFNEAEKLARKELRNKKEMSGITFHNEEVDIYNSFQERRLLHKISKSQALTEAMKLWIEYNPIQPKSTISKGTPPSKKQISKEGDIGIVPKNGKMRLAKDD